jgi:AcrR family transcriptional regulator
MSDTKPSSGPHTRGPAEHEVREQIVAAAGQHFSHYGYEKTAVSDLAKAIGFSKAYIYKFFDSKQAIGEAICAQTLDAVGGRGRRRRGPGRRRRRKNSGACSRCWPRPA